MKKLLEISHLKKSFGDTEVLKDISMEVNEGEVVAILGPSGSGKSTLLSCATLLETMDGLFCPITCADIMQKRSSQKTYIKMRFPIISRCI